MHNARRGITAAGVVLLWCAGAVTVQAQTLRQVVQQPEITKLKFTGNANISSAELQAAIATEGSHCKIFLVCKAAKWNWTYKRITLDRAELERDLLRLRVLYWKRGWRAATVTPQVTSEGKQKVSILLRVTEGPPTTIGTLALGAIDSLLTTDELRKLIDVRPGQPLDLIHLDSIAVRIALHLDGEGYGDVTINPVAVVDDNSPNAAVTFELARLYRTRVETVRVEGTERYDPRLVANTMRIKPGDDYSRGAVAESQRALYEAGFFKRAVVRVDSGSADSLKKLIALVEELPVRAFRVTGGVSTVDFLQLDARYTDANFRNSAGRLTLQATLGNVLASKFNGRTPFVNALPEGLLSDSQPVYLQPTFQVNADIRRRWLRDSRNQTGLSVFGYRRSSPGVFIDQGGGAGASFTRNVSRAVPLSIQYRLEFTKVSAADTYFCVNFGVCDQTSLSVLKRTQRLAPLAITASSDRRDDPIGPTTGYTWRSELELADQWTGSQLGYARVELEGSKYFHASDKLTFAMHGRAGYVRGFSRSGNSFGQSTAPVILPRKRFYAGGARSVRGYGENQLGPRVLVIPRNAFQPSAADFVRFFTDDSLLQRRVPCTPLVNLPDCSTSALAAPIINRRPTSDFADADFTPKPLGAETLVEGSIEARYRFWGPLTFAAFIDAGSVGAQFGGTATVFTPGIGLRFISPVGPIRVDVGYNPKSEERLSVITELVPSDAGWLAARGSAQREGLFEITNKRIFNPSTGTGLGGVLNRLTLHLSIGEAF